MEPQITIWPHTVTLSIRLQSADHCGHLLIKLCWSAVICDIEAQDFKSSQVDILCDNDWVLRILWVSLSRQTLQFSHLAKGVIFRPQHVCSSRTMWISKTVWGINSWKKWLDNHWASQELRYNREVEISRIGSRSRVESLTVTVTVTINGLVKLSAFNAHICPSKYLASFWKLKW